MEQKQGSAKGQGRGQARNTDQRSSTKKKQGSRKKGGCGKATAILAVLCLILNLLGCAKEFCDWYKLHIYGILSDGLGLATGWFSLPLGEILGYLGAAALLFGVALLLLLPLRRKQKKFRRFAKGYGQGLLLAGMILLFIYTLNWILPFRGSILQVQGAEERGYTLEEVQNVRNYLVRQLNACAEEALRDEQGRLSYDQETVLKAIFEAMEAQATDYPLLSGYYPPLKNALYKDFLEWMNIGGYTYPYTMEITVNPYVDHLYAPFLFAHEAAHHQGYYLENEANFVAFLACTHSEDPLVRYAGYLESYTYVNNAYLSTLFETYETKQAVAIYKEQPQMSDRVKQDRLKAREERQERYDAVSHPAQDLAPASARVADVVWSVQGDVLKENSYDGVVKMVLEYYDVKEGGLGDAF